MKIFVDENIPRMTVSALREQGFEVIDIRGSEDQGLTDDAIWREAQKEKCLLVTTDKGFSSHREEPHHGILIIRLKQPTRLKIHQRIMLAIGKYSEKEWPGLMVVMRDMVQSTWRGM